MDTKTISLLFVFFAIASSGCSEGDTGSSLASQRNFGRALTYDESYNLALDLLKPADILNSNEGRFKGHTIARHVGRSNEQLESRLHRGIRKSSTFDSHSDANRIVRQVIKNNLSTIAQWGTQPRSNGIGKLSNACVWGASGTYTGRMVDTDYITDKNDLNAVFAAKIIIKKQNGKFVVLTAFPSADDCSERFHGDKESNFFSFKNKSKPFHKKEINEEGSAEETSTNYFGKPYFANHEDDEREESDTALEDLQNEPLESAVNISGEYSLPILTSNLNQYFKGVETAKALDEYSASYLATITRSTRSSLLQEFQQLFRLYKQDVEHANFLLDFTSTNSGRQFESAAAARQWLLQVYHTVESS
jgi:hypothetical protein